MPSYDPSSGFDRFRFLEDESDTTDKKTEVTWVALPVGSANVGAWCMPSWLTIPHGQFIKFVGAGATLEIRGIQVTFRVEITPPSGSVPGVYKGVTLTLAAPMGGWLCSATFEVEGSETTGYRVQYQSFYGYRSGMLTLMASAYGMNDLMPLP